MRRPRRARSAWLFLTILFLLAFLPACSAFRKQAKVPEASTQAPKQAISKLADTRLDIKYRTVDGVDLHLDVYTPKGQKGPFPVVIYIHGGGWSSGDKSGGAGMTETPELLLRGYAVISINYRLAPKYTVPKQLDDVKYAVRWVKSNARDLKIDPGRLGLLGGSAGGHLVSMLGVTGPEDGLEGDFDLPAKSSKVQAVVDFFGPADLAGVDITGNAAQTIAQAFGVKPGDAGAKELLRKYSPVTYASKDDPPFLIVQGAKDTTVPLSQSESLYNALKQAGAAVDLVVVKNAGHSFAPVGGAISPSRQEISGLVGDFFDRTLK